MRLPHLSTASFITILLLQTTTSALPQPIPQSQSPEGIIGNTPPQEGTIGQAPSSEAPAIQDNGNQGVTIQDPTTASSPLQIPITALAYSSSSGPKLCRGSLVASLSLPQPASQHILSRCYNLPRTARCGMFMANKEDGCEAKLFNDVGCPEGNQTASYVNTVVFMPEQRAVGGMWKSISIRCGVEPPAEGAVGPLDMSKFLPGVA